jgi:hypothetical protein
VKDLKGLYKMQGHILGTKALASKKPSLDSSAVFSFNAAEAMCTSNYLNSLCDVFSFVKYA